MIKILSTYKTQDYKDERFIEVVKEKEVDDLVKVAKELCDLNYRYFSLVSNDYTIQKPIERKVDLVYKGKRYGNSCICCYDDIYFDDSAKDKYYVIVGICGVIAVMFVFKNKLYVIQRNNIIKLNSEYLQGLIEQIKEDEKIEDVVIEKSFSDDLCREIEE